MAIRVSVTGSLTGEQLLAQTMARHGLAARLLADLGSRPSKPVTLFYQGVRIDEDFTPAPAIEALGLTAAFAAAPALAKVSADQAAKLGGELTPVGAEAGANADGSIPAWSGGLKSAPSGYKSGTRYTDPFGSGNTGSCVRILVGHTTVMRSPAFCITTGVERSFWPAIGAPGG